MPLPQGGGALSDLSVRLSVCLSQDATRDVRTADPDCGLRTRPRTDVDPPRVELPSAGGISSRRPRGDNLLILRCLAFSEMQQLRKVQSAD